MWPLEARKGKGVNSSLKSLQGLPALSCMTVCKPNCAVLSLRFMVICYSSNRTRTDPALSMSECGEMFLLFWLHM